MASSSEPETLPVQTLHASFEKHLERGPVVITSPTGSGKSTLVPCWCPGPVLVVEPRRLACRALAQRVAELEGTALGDAVGYRVRDEHCAHDRTRVVFATPGVVLRSTAEWSRFQTVIVDELHERSLDVDLLLGLLAQRFRGHLVVMSATLDGDRVAAHLEGYHLRAEGRTHPVTLKYLDGGVLLPDPQGIEARVRRALDQARGDPGDVLVFLPGKAEIKDCARALRGRSEFEIIELHGGLSIDEQRRAFGPSDRRKVVLATNVAETSITLPGVGVVIDAGLVRQTRYRDGRGYLTLVPIAEDSADQRAGRAGRTGPGVCYRLWSQAAKLAPPTTPEVYRESLVPLVLAAAACGERPEALRLLDPPKPHALSAARDELTAHGAIDASGDITARGRQLFGMPLDAHLGRLLVEAQGAGCLADAIDLVAVLAAGRALFLPGSRPDFPEDDLRAGGCDVSACVRALRFGDPETHRLHRATLEEARRISARLRRAHDLPERADPGAAVDREALARTALAADPRCVHVARRRGREVLWSNGGTEVELARESALAEVHEVEAIAVLDTRAVVVAGGGGREARILVTCATPLPLRWLVAAGLGRDRLGGVSLDRGRVVAQVERVYARRVIAEREEVPQGEIARAALCALFLRGSVFRQSLAVTRERLAAAALAAKMLSSGYPLDCGEWRPPSPAESELEAWVMTRLAALGVESGDDLALLGAADLTAPPLPAAVCEQMDQVFPRTVQVGDAGYEADYDFERRQVTLRRIHGARRDPPPLIYLPHFPGLRICVEVGGSMRILRERG